VDNYHEEIPRPSTCFYNAEAFNGSVANKEVRNLDGDWCVVQFVGGRIDQPIMTGWFPHPGNFRDPATLGIAGTLSQGRRMFKRFAGTKISIGADGSILIDTNEAGALFKGSDSGFTRQRRDGGGDLQIDMKDGSIFEVNFNPPVAKPTTHPSWPQDNPGTGIEETRETTATRLRMDKDFILAVAQAIIDLKAADEVNIQAPSVSMGSNPPALPPDSGVVTGQSVDSFTGTTFFALGQASNVVKAEK
jgi:hypothetical protein